MIAMMAMMIKKMMMELRSSSQDEFSHNGSGDTDKNHSVCITILLITNKLKVLMVHGSNRWITMVVDTPNLQ